MRVPQGKHSSWSLKHVRVSTSMSRRDLAEEQTQVSHESHRAVPFIEHDGNSLCNPQALFEWGHLIEKLFPGQDLLLTGAVESRLKKTV